jgi:division protein CdvB (Snf7/Vps24/ESCRT-III family)
MSQFTGEIEQFLADDMEVLREVLHTVRGIMPVSTSPAVEAMLADELDFEAAA